MSLQTDIQTAASQIVGALPADEETLLYTLCDAAMQELQRRLRPGVTPEDCGKCFTAAAALTAVSLFRAAQEGEVSEFGAAGLSVKLLADGGAMRKLAEELLAPWCDGGTAFRGVRA